MIFSKNQRKQLSIITIFTSLSLHGPIFLFRPNVKHLTRAIKTHLLQNHRNTAKLTTTATTAIFKSAPRSATTTSSSSTATASNTQSHHNHFTPPSSVTKHHLSTVVPHWKTISAQTQCHHLICKTTTTA
jgi:hypothetical protein